MINTLQFKLQSFYRKIVMLEDLIREQLFRRSHLKTETNSVRQLKLKINQTKLIVEIEENANVDQECCGCHTEFATSWKRAFDGNLKCNLCFLFNDQRTVSIISWCSLNQLNHHTFVYLNHCQIYRELPYRVLMINGIPKKY